MRQKSSFKAKHLRSEAKKRLEQMMSGGQVSSTSSAHDEHRPKDTTDDLSECVSSMDYTPVKEIVDRLEKFAGHYREAYQKGMKRQRLEESLPNLLGIDNYLVNSSAYKNSPSSFAETLDAIVNTLKQVLAKDSYKEAAHHIQSIVDGLEPVVKIYQATSGRKVRKDELDAALKDFQVSLPDLVKPTEKKGKKQNPVLYISFGYMETYVLLVAKDVKKMHTAMFNAGLQCWLHDSIDGAKFLLIKEKGYYQGTQHLLRSMGIPYTQIDPGEVFNFYISNAIIRDTPRLEMIAAYYNKFIV